MNKNKDSKWLKKQKKIALRKAKSLLIINNRISSKLLTGPQVVARYIRHNYKNIKDADCWNCIFKLSNDNNQKVIKKKPSVSGDNFLMSYEWRSLRMMAIKKYGNKCMCCGASPSDGIVINVDHIKPRKRFPELSLDINNLQILCNVCNHGKGNWDTTDWRDNAE